MFCCFLSKPQRATAEGRKSRMRLKSHSLQTADLGGSIGSIWQKSNIIIINI